MESFHLRNYDTEGVIEWLSDTLPNLIMARKGESLEILKRERVDGAYLVKHSGNCGDLIAELLGMSMYHGHAIAIYEAVMERVKREKE